MNNYIDELTPSLINKKIANPVVALTLGLFTALILTMILSASFGVKATLSQTLNYDQTVCGEYAC